MSSKYSLVIHYKHRKTGMISSKTFIVSAGEEASLENLLRITFQIPPNEGLLINCQETVIYYPVHMIDLETVTSDGGRYCELQTFPLTIPSATADSSSSSSLPTSVSNDQSGEEPLKKARVTKTKATRRTTPATATAVTTISPAPGQVSSAYLHPSLKEDKRKFNRGLDQRRSYLREEKIFVMLMKDCGKSAEEISQLTGVSKSNVEKWCSEKVREKIIVKFKQDSKSAVVDEALRENRLHFTTVEGIKFKMLLEFLAEKLFEAQQNSSSYSMKEANANLTIPQNIFWKLSSVQNKLASLPQPPQQLQQGEAAPMTRLFSPHDAIQYLLDQGFFFGKNTNLAEKTPSMISDNDAMVTKELQAVNSCNGTFVSSEESDLSLGLADDQSVLSSQWPYPNNNNNNSNPNTVAGSSVPMNVIPVSVEGDDENNLLGNFDDYNFDDLDSDFDDSDTSVDDVTCNLIRQGIIPKIQPSKVCNRPNCMESILESLREEVRTTKPIQALKSEFTMQYRHKFTQRIPVEPNSSEMITVSTFAPVQGYRGVLRNTKFLSTVRDQLSGKVYTEEELEDAAVLTLLGE